MRLCNSRIPEEHLVRYQTSQRNWVIIKMLYRCLQRCLLSWHRSRLGFVTLSIHWYASVLNKRFLTPFRDGIWNCRQVSVGDRGVLPTRPRNCQGYALLAHTLGKMRSCHEHSNTEICTLVLKIQLYMRNHFRS